MVIPLPIWWTFQLCRSLNWEKKPRYNHPAHITHIYIDTRFNWWIIMMYGTHKYQFQHVLLYPDGLEHSKPSFFVCCFCKDGHIQHCHVLGQFKGGPSNVVDLGWTKRYEFMSRNTTHLIYNIYFFLKAFSNWNGQSAQRNLFDFHSFPLRGILGLMQFGQSTAILVN